MKLFFNYCIIFFTLILLNNCASIGYPPGGDADYDPPKLLNISPIQSSLNINKKQSIELFFDELLDPLSVSSSINIEPKLEFDTKLYGSKIVISPKKEWNDGPFKILITRNLSDYSTKRNKLDSPIEIFFSTSNDLTPQIFTGTLVNTTEDKVYEVALLDQDLNILSKTQADSQNNFNLSIADKISSNIFFLALENKMTDNIKSNIMDSRYGLSSNYVTSEKQNLYLSNPIFRNTINTVKLVNDNFGFFVVSDGTELPFILNDTFFSGLISQIDNFYYYDYNHSDSLLVTLNMQNEIEDYKVQKKIKFSANAVDTNSAKIIEHYSSGNKYIINFDEPILFDNKKIFIDKDDNQIINFKYLSPLSVELSNNNFNSLEVQSYLVKDLNNNFMIDSITTISKREEVINQFDLFGEINGTVEYSGKNNIIVEVVNLENDLKYNMKLNQGSFSFNKLPPGNYKLWVYEDLNKLNDSYFSGTLDPFKLAAKFSIYKKDVAVRANWKNAISMVLN